MNEQLGDYLKRIRKEKNFTLRCVEEKTGISNAYLSQLENKKISSPSPTVLRKMADFYGVSYSKLMELVGYPMDDVEKNRVLFRASGKVEEVTPEEEKELLNYLRFLRMRRQQE